MAFPFLPIAIVLSSLISGLFGGKKQTQTTEQETQQRRPMDPTYWPMANMLAQALSARGEMFGGFGMPGGQSSWPTDMMPMFRKMLEGSFNKMGSGGMGPKYGSFSF